MTAFTDEVRETYGGGRKFDSRRAAAAWLVAMDGGADEDTGDTIEWEGWMARIGRTILETDPQGFVVASSFARESDAMAVFSATAERYGEYLDAREQETQLILDGYVQGEQPTLTEFYPGDAVTLDGEPGIAYRVVGIPGVAGPDTEWTGYAWWNAAKRVIHMVGDDRETEVDVADLSPLDEDDYCPGCGQIGCPWH